MTDIVADGFGTISQQYRQFAKEIDPRLRKLLRAFRRPRAPKQKMPDSLPVFQYLDEFVHPKTDEDVKRKTTWDAKGWEWMVFANFAERERLLRAGSFYLAELGQLGGWLSLNDICDKDEFKTVDGRFFLAYRKRKKSIAKMLKRRTLKRLREAKLIKTKGDLYRNIRLGAQSRAVLNNLLKARH